MFGVFGVTCCFTDGLASLYFVKVTGCFTDGLTLLFFVKVTGCFTDGPASLFFVKVVIYMWARTNSRYINITVAQLRIYKYPSSFFWIAPLFLSH